MANRRKLSIQKPVCFNCKTESDDPCEPLSPVKRRIVGFDENKHFKFDYVCTWCAFNSKGFSYSEFLRKRGWTE